MEWAGCKGNLLDRSEDGLSEEKDCPIRVEWVCHLQNEALRMVAQRKSKKACLLHEIPTADNNRRTRFTDIFCTIVVQICMTLFQIPRDDELEIPCTFLEEIVHAGHPTPRRVR